MVPLMEYYILRWTGSPLEYQPSVSNMSTQSLVNLPKYRLSHCHDIHPSTSMLIFQSLQWTTLDAHTIHRSNPSARPPSTPSYIPCRSCMTTRTLWQTSEAICAHNSLPWYSHVSHSWPDSVRPHHTSQTKPLITHTLYSLVHILDWIPVPVRVTLQQCHSFNQRYSE